MVSLQMFPRIKCQDIETPKRHSPLGVVKVVAAVAEVGGAVVDATVLPSATVVDTVVSEIHQSMGQAFIDISNIFLFWMP